MDINLYHGLKVPLLFMGVVTGIGFLFAVAGLWNEGGAAAGLGSFLVILGSLGGTAWGLENLRNDRQSS